MAARVATLAAGCAGVRASTMVRVEGVLREFA
jgi:hypothetical protein